MAIPSKERIKSWWAHYKNSLAVRLVMIIITVLIFMSVAFVFAAIIVGKSTREEQMQKESERLITGLETNIDSYVSSVKSLSRSIMIDEQVAYYLKCISPDAGTTNDTRYAVMKILNAYTNIDSVFVIRLDDYFMATGRDKYVFNLDRFDSGEWKDELSEKKGGALVCKNGNYLVHTKNTNGNLSVARAIYDIDSQKKTGYLAINISSKMLEEVIHNQNNGDVCIVSERGIYLAGEEKLQEYFDPEAPEGEILVQREQNRKGNGYICKYRMPNAPLEIICRGELISMKIPTTILWVLGIFLVTFIISIFSFGLFVVKEINHPIYKLIDSMEDTKKSGWMKRLDVEMTSVEFGKLANSYDSLIEYLNDLFKSLIEKEKIIQRAEMQVLNEQVKPHFLSNSLETISYMAVEEGADNVHQALNTLGSFYRNFLSKGSREIPLEREIRIIKDYLALQKLRYEDIIIDEYDIADDTLKCMVPKLLLQPLVENSIYHGIRPLGEPGIIRISSSIEENNLKLTVYDAGIGMSQEQIDELFERNEKEHASVESGLSGFGLKGTIERVRHYCNSDEAINITSEEGEYTQIVILIPLFNTEVSEDLQSNDYRR